MRALALSLSLLLAPAALAQGYKPPSAVNAAGRSSKTITAPRLTLTTALDSPAITFGSGAYLYENGDPGAVTLSGPAATRYVLAVGNVGSMTSLREPDAADTTILDSTNGTQGVELRLDPATDTVWWRMQTGGVNGQADLTFSADGFRVSSTQAGNGFGIGATGTIITGSYRGTLTVDIASIAANVCAADQPVTVTGAAAGAECIVGAPAALPASLILTCYVSALNTAQLRICNHSAGAVDPPSLTYAVRTFNP